jgi:hypothetical protein
MNNPLVMKKRNLIYIATLLVFCSCQKEQVTNYISFLKNKTNHSIKILFFKNGIVNSSDTLKLFLNQEIKIADGFFRGLVTSPRFQSNYFGGSNDSVVVIFDNLYSITHYASTPQFLSNKFYLNTSQRNIYNPNSYIFESVLESKNSRFNTHLYEFTEQDYLDAK